MNSVSVARECCKAGARDPMCKVYLQRRIMQQPLVFRVFFSIFSFFHRNMSHGISGSAGISHSLPLNSLKLSIIVRPFLGEGVLAPTRLIGNFRDHEWKVRPKWRLNSRRCYRTVKTFPAESVPLSPLLETF